MDLDRGSEPPTEPVTWGHLVYAALVYGVGGVFLVVLGAMLLSNVLKAHGNLAVAFQMMRSGTTEIAYDNERPHDCDFLRAPIGNKDCHYERIYYKDGTVLHVGWNKVDD